ncbi:hypothetical protein HHK36_016689 [Tetracentron sinense]|uniref:Late embryogenesis abundant protein LEA-2 subgroup domain-containing protein n=1 Tax=Tetracentron sinense TaxID=13715 RepID=A0A834Z0X2_TETSI|nr:hypothetical protein HHK36_016689 [Tetracentron sinense]
MASPSSSATMQAIPSSRWRLSNCIPITILFSVLLFCLSVFIVWLVIRPKGLVYTIEDGSVHGFDLKNNHLNATFDFILRSYNHNRKVSVNYDSIKVSVSYEGETIASDFFEPFFQPHRNVTRFEVKPVARSVSLMEFVARDLRLEKSSGKVRLAVEVKARIGFKVGVWNSAHRTLRVLCSPVVVFVSSSEKADRTFCNTDI